jgi:hypothetical protein
VFVHNVHCVLYAILNTCNCLKVWNKDIVENLTVAALFKKS